MDKKRKPPTKEDTALIAALLGLPRAPIWAKAEVYALRNEEHGNFAINGRQIMKDGEPCDIDLTADDPDTAAPPDAR